MTLNIAVNYGGRPESVRAARQLAQQVASVAVSEARTLTITPWDRTLLRAISKAIMARCV